MTARFDRPLIYELVTPTPWILAPGSVCVDIETAVSIDKTHRMSTAMKTITKNLRRRKNK